MNRIAFLIILLVNISSFNSSASNSDTFYYKGKTIVNDSVEQVLLMRFYINPKGEVVGYTLTDPNSPLETKCKITGTYNSNTQTLIFKEVKVLRTNIDTAANPHPFMSGRVIGNKNNQLHTYEGDFIRTFNGANVASGKIRMVNTKLSKKAKSRFEKLIKKMEASMPKKTKEN